MSASPSRSLGSSSPELRRLAGERTIAVTYSDVCTGAGTPAPAAVSPLEVAARRSLIGLSIIDLATALDVNEKTVRRWESPTDATPISERNLARLDSLVAEHTAAVEAVTTITEITIGDRRSRPTSADDHPAGISSSMDVRQ